MLRDGTEEEIVFCYFGNSKQHDRADNFYYVLVGTKKWNSFGSKTKGKLLVIKHF